MAVNSSVLTLPPGMVPTFWHLVVRVYAETGGDLLRMRAALGEVDVATLMGLLRAYHQEVTRDGHMAPFLSCARCGTPTDPRVCMGYVDDTAVCLECRILTWLDV